MTHSNARLTVQVRGSIGAPWRATLTRPASMRPEVQKRIDQLNTKAGFDKYRIRPETTEEKK